MNIQQVIDQVTSCTKCELCKTRTNAVPGKGNFKSDVIFIGEAPGRNEDRNGEPFVGAAGKKLTSALESAGITRESVYITNVVKCRPPNNRVPTKSEKEACQRYLEQEVALIKPQIICIMGNTAYGSILQGSDITKNRGKVIKKGPLLYYLTIHPAATIYNQKLIDVLKLDVKKLFKLITELKNGKKIKIDIEYSS